MQHAALQPHISNWTQVTPEAWGGRGARGRPGAEAKAVLAACNGLTCSSEKLWKRVESMKVSQLITRFIFARQICVGSFDKTQIDSPHVCMFILFKKIKDVRDV